MTLLLALLLSLLPTPTTRTVTAVHGMRPERPPVTAPAVTAHHGR